jgi:hypothetical protein
VVPLSDDDDVIALAGKGCDGAVRDADQRARGFDDGQSKGAGTRKRSLRRTVSGHHHDRRVHVRGLVRDRNAFGVEGAKDGGIVNELTENRERPGVRVLERKRDGVSNTEAHAEVSGADDTHRHLPLYTDHSVM